MSRHFIDAMLDIVVNGRGGAGLRTWSGATPCAQDEATPHTVAQMVGYQVAPESDAFAEVTSSEAVGALAFFATDSMVMPTGAEPPSNLLLSLERYIARMGPHARFYSNGPWHDRRTSSWHPISDATFDGGVIGMNEDVAFIAWFEEED